MYTKYGVHKGRRYRYDLTVVGLGEVGTNVHFAVVKDSPLSWLLGYWFKRFWNLIVRN